WRRLVSALKRWGNFWAQGLVITAALFSFSKTAPAQNSSWLTRFYGKIEDGTDRVVLVERLSDMKADDPLRDQYNVGNFRVFLGELGSIQELDIEAITTRHPMNETQLWCTEPTKMDGNNVIVIQVHGLPYDHRARFIHSYDKDAKVYFLVSSSSLQDGHVARTSGIRVEPGNDLLIIPGFPKSQRHEEYDLVSALNIRAGTALPKALIAIEENPTIAAELSLEIRRRLGIEETNDAIPPSKRT